MGPIATSALSWVRVLIFLGGIWLITKYMSHVAIYLPRNQSFTHLNPAHLLGLYKLCLARSPAHHTVVRRSTVCRLIGALTFSVTTASEPLYQVKLLGALRSGTTPRDPWNYYES